MNVLFVCTGNTCRSPMAAAVCGALANAKGLHIKASSAGLFARDGAPASSETVAVLAEKGICLKHSARKLTPALVEAADILIPLTPEHRGFILQNFPTAKEEKIVCLPASIKDPFGGNLQVYRDTLTEIVRGVHDFLQDFEAKATVEILPMEAGHLDEVYRLEKMCFSDPWSKDSVRELLFHPHGKAYIAAAGNQVAGYIFLFFDSVEATVGNIAVAPAFRGYGIGEKLMQTIIDDAKQKGLQWITLEVRSRNIPAITLYQKLGFSIVGSRKNYYKNPTDDAHLMKLLLQGKE